MKPSLSFIALFLNAVTLLVAQQLPPGNAGPPQTPGSISGKVVNSVTGQSVKKAVVTVVGSSGHNTYVTGSDESGKFVLDNIQPDRYTFSALADGYTNQMRMLGKPVTVAAQQDVSGVEVRIAPLSVISGKVVDEDGQPLEQATVIALRYAYTGMGRRLQASGSGQINDRGEYRIFDLQPGRYYLLAQSNVRSAPAFAPGAHVHTTIPIKEEAYAPAYYPGAGSLAEATPQELKAGAEWTGADFKLHLLPAYHIRGRLTSAIRGDVRTAIRAHLCGEDEIVGSPHIASQQPDGRFDVPGVVAGVYCLTVNQLGTPGAAEAATVTVKSGDVEGVEVSAGGSFVVSGTVLIDGTPPATMPPIAIALTGSSGMPNQRGVMKSDGTFQIPGVSPGAYTMMLPQGSPLYAKSVLYGSQDVTAGTIASLQPGVPLTITMGADTGQISGTVQAGNVEIGAPVVIVAIPDNDYAARPDLHRVTTGFAGSSFTLSTTPPGSYKVYAIETDDFGEASNSDFIKLLTGSAAQVTVQASGSAQASPTAIPFADVEQARRKLK